MDDKRTLIARAAQDSQDRLLLARVLDKYEQTAQRSVPTATEFLSPREQALAQAALSAAHIRSGFCFDGGYDAAERKKLFFLPDWADSPSDALAFLRASFYRADSALTHRDILGSLMGLGITRERVGDILLSEQSADVVVSPALAEFLLAQWDSAGRVKLTVKEISREELTVPEVKMTQARDTVSSLRLDALVSSAFRMSRGRAGELIAAGRVSLDHAVCQKPDKPMSEGCVITCRGLGKAQLSHVLGETKKGRISIIISHYQ